MIRVYKKVQLFCWKIGVIKIFVVSTYRGKKGEDSNIKLIYSFLSLYLFWAWIK